MQALAKGSYASTASPGILYHLRHSTTYRVSPSVAHYDSHDKFSSAMTQSPTKMAQMVPSNGSEHSAVNAPGSLSAADTGHTELASSGVGLSLLDSIGNTPLLRLDAMTAELPGVTILGK